MEEKMGLEFRIPQPKLREALDIVVAAAGTKQVAAGTFFGSLLMRAEESKLTFTVADYQAHTTLSVPAALVTQDGDAVVPTKLLAELAASFPPDKSVDVTAHLIQNAVANDTLSEPIPTHTAVECGRSRSKLKPPCDGEAFPRQGEDGGGGVTFPAELFIQSVGQVAFAAATDESRPVLTGLCFEFSGDELTMVAADGFRLAAKTLPRSALQETKAEGWTVIIPALTLERLAKVLKKLEVDEVEMKVVGDRAAFSAEGMKMDAALVAGRFPNWQGIIPSGREFTFLASTDDVTKVLNQAQLFRDYLGGRCAARFHLDSFDGGVVRVTSREAEVGGFNGQVKALEMEGVAFDDFALNAKFLLDVVKRLEGPIRFNGTTPTSPLHLMDGTGSLQFLIMPFHLKD